MSDQREALTDFVSVKKYKNPEKSSTVRFIT